MPSLREEFQAHRASGASCSHPFVPPSSTPARGPTSNLRRPRVPQTRGVPLPPAQHMTSTLDTAHKP